MNVEVYKILEEAKEYNYDQSDMGEPGTVYIPPIEVSMNGPSHLWSEPPKRSIGGGSHRQSRQARVEYKVSVSKPPTQPIETLREPGQESDFGNSNSNTGRNIETSQNSETRHGGLIRWIIHEEDAFAFLNDDSI